MNSDFWNIESSKLSEIKGELGMATKDVPSMTIEEKVAYFPPYGVDYMLSTSQARMIELAKRRGWMQPMRPGPSMPPNAVAGSSMGPMQNQVPRIPAGLRTPQNQNVNVKRSSSSPGDEVCRRVGVRRRYQNETFSTDRDFVYL